MLPKRWNWSVADPGFPRGSANQPLIWSKNLLFGQFFCRRLHKKWKKLNRQGGGAHSLRPLGSANVDCCVIMAEEWMCFTSWRYNLWFNNTISSTYLLEDKKNYHPYWCFTKDHEITSITSQIERHSTRLFSFRHEFQVCLQYTYIEITQALDNSW